jgi:hypothetical protein
MDWNRARDFGAKGGIILILVVAFISACVSVLSSFLYSSQFQDYQAREIEKLFDQGREFSQVAKDILNVRSDVAYLKLLDENGVLKESFGGESGKGVKEFELRTTAGNTVMLGLRESADKNVIFYSALWSLLIGGALAGICFFLLAFLSSDQSVYLERLIAAMKRVSRGDFSTKLDVDESMLGDVTMTRLFEGFNQMVDYLKKKEDSIKEAREAPVFQPTVVVSESREKIKLRRVVALVAKISDFKNLSSKLDSAEFTSFLTDYRRTASTIISDYGGVVEALLQDEIVALFNVPDEQERPELRAICAAVEVLQLLAGMSRQRKMEGKDAISGKIGIDEKSIPFYTESIIPQNVREVISLARTISEGAPLWKVIVSPDVYKNVSKYVEANKLTAPMGTLFSIVAVEEWAVQL